MSVREAGPPREREVVSFLRPEEVGSAEVGTGTMREGISVFKENPRGKECNHVCVLPFITTITRTLVSTCNTLLGKVAAEGIGMFGSRGPQPSSVGLMIR